MFNFFTTVAVFILEDNQSGRRERFLNIFGALSNNKLKLLKLSKKTLVYYSVFIQFRSGPQAYTLCGVQSDYAKSRHETVFVSQLYHIPFVELP